ncbi:MAG: polyprenol monophosphomannose synthase [Ardenticatenia bacterium]|nr:polyprenol monophosphomannose synthase [Ardenticatenia bacterium]
MRATIIIPTYNERENIPGLIAELERVSSSLNVLIVDDNSPDGTGTVAEELARCRDWVRVLHRPEKLGLGTAYVDGFRLALANGAERIITMDADFSHHPRYIPPLLEASEEYDVVIGSRYVPGGGTRHWPWYRVLLSWGANTFVRFMLNLHTHDCTAGFRCYRREVVEAIEPHTIRSNGYSFLVEVVYRCERQGWRIGEVPIIFADRRRGASKISRQEIYRAMWMVWRLRFCGDPVWR